MLIICLRNITFIIIIIIAVITIRLDKENTLIIIIMKVVCLTMVELLTRVRVLVGARANAVWATAWKKRRRERGA